MSHEEAVPATASPLPDLVLAITGASGAPYAVRLLETLCRLGRTVHLTLSPSAAQVMREETGLAVALNRFDPQVFGDLSPGCLIYHHHADFTAGIASGSFLTGGMVIIPCSMSTLGAIAHGVTTNLITRAADVHLKERRKLILVPRETPLSLIHLKNMTQVTRAGAIVLPAMPGWYHRPRQLDDLIDFIVGRICDQLGIPNRMITRWGSDESKTEGLEKAFAKAAPPASEGRPGGEGVVLVAVENRRNTRKTDDPSGEDQEG